jgi:hypothetical protein
MYSRYMRGSFWEEPAETAGKSEQQSTAASFSAAEKTQNTGKGLPGLLKGMDASDLLLAAIILLLLIESDDIEPVIALAFVLLTGL